MDKNHLFTQLISHKHTRIMLCDRDLYAFACYYLGEKMKAVSADFHHIWAKEMGDDYSMVIVAFRESAKTFWLMARFLQCICYRKKRFCMYYCYTGDRSGARLYDIVNELKTNKKILADFGHLLWSDENERFSRSKTKKESVTEFITRNSVRVKAMGIGESPRGEVYMAEDGMFRPDLVGLDDIDVDKSVANPNNIEKVYRWLKGEMMGGLSADRQIIFLGNVIKPDGCVIRFYHDFKRAYKKWRTHWIPAETANGRVTWDTYFTADEEPKPGMVSLSQKKVEMGDIGYNQNYRLIPYQGGETIIRHDMIHNNPIIWDGAEGPVVIGVDPAISEKTLGDGFAIVATKHHKDGRRQVLSCHLLRGKEKSYEVSLPIVERVYRDTGASIVHLEGVAFQSILAKMLRERGVAVKEVYPHKDKVTRLMELQARFQNGTIQFDLSGPGVKDLVEELKCFPNVLHDDRTDAFIYSLLESKTFVFG